LVKETVSVDSKEDGSVLVDVVPISIVSPVFPILELLVELFTCFVGERTSAVGMVVGVGNVVGFTVGHILSSALVLFAPESGVGKAVGLEVGQVLSFGSVLFASDVGDSIPKVGSMAGTISTLDGIEGDFVTVGVEVMLTVILFIGPVSLLEKLGEGNPFGWLSPLLVGFLGIGLLGFLVGGMFGT